MKISNADTTEGVIKFNLEFTRADLPMADSLVELNAWRQVLFRLGLTGRDPARYGGLAYGNVSQRLGGDRRFIVSGTQTGSKPCLGSADYCQVLDFDLATNWLRAEGPLAPSSEALTHGAVYDAIPQAACVIHVHSQEIWRNARKLGIALTDPVISCGTTQMGSAVGKAVGSGGSVIAMGGHEDGVLAFAASPEEAVTHLLRCLAKALEHDVRLMLS
jgi:hypothetical protein